MESDPADTPIVVQIARIAFLSVMITIAAWLVTNYALSLLGASFSTR
jgi:drug/metabolite transporter (DMT)-like permease